MIKQFVKGIVLIINIYFENIINTGTEDSSFQTSDDVNV